MDTTVGGANADSYATLAEAAAYLDVQPGRKKTRWTALTDPQREAALLMATQAIESMRFHGVKSTTTQALAFPRTVDTHDSGVTYFIPPNVKYAQIETALSVVESDQVDMPENLTGYTIGSYSAQLAGVIQGLLPPTAMRWLRPFVSQLGRIVSSISTTSSSDPFS